jgi:hypothetical protein
VISATDLADTLETSGWTLELRASETGVTGLATRPDEQSGQTLRLTAWGRDRASVVLLLFEQACARMLPDYPQAA